MIESKTIPLENIYISSLNVRKNYDQDAYETNITELASNIKQYGLLNPLTVRESPDRPGMYEVVAGQRRYMALQQLKWDNAPCRVVPFKDDEDIMLISLAENIQRCSMTVQDKCTTIHKLYITHKKNINVVKYLTNLSISTLKRYLNISDNLSPTLFDRFDEKGEGRLTVDIADLLVKAVPHKGRQRKALRILRRLKTNRERKVALGKLIKNPKLSLESIVRDIKPSSVKKKKQTQTINIPWIPDPQNKPHPIPKELYKVIYDLVKKFQ